MLAVTTTEVSPAQQRTRTRPSQTTNPYATNPEHIAQKKQKRDERAANRAEQQAAREATHNASQLIHILESCFAGEFEQASRLLADVPNINHPVDSQGNTILHAACILYSMRETDLEQVLTFLIEEHDANPAQLNKEKQTILHTICQYDLGEQAEHIIGMVIEFLGDRKNNLDIHGRHALHYACLNSDAATNYFLSQNIHKLLLHTKDGQGLTPMHLAAIRNSEILDQLFSYQATTHPIISTLHWAADNNMRNIVQKQLAQPGINIHEQVQPYGVTALHLAAQHGYTEIVQLLIAAGFQVNTPNNHSSRALHFAASLGHTETVQMLLTVPGVNINARDSSNNTALHGAARNGHIAIVRALINAGINTLAQDDYGHTAAHKAKTEEIRLLIEAATAQQAQ